MTATAGKRAAKTKKPFPILEGVLPIKMPDVPTEVIAGLTLAALAMPEVMGYAKIADMPVILGLYTLVLPMAAFAFFGSSRHLVVGADSATAAVLATGLAGIAAAGAPGSTSWVALGSLAALICAVFMIVGRIIRLGFIANFLSHSVLIGFLTGVGIQVAMGQVAGMFGVDAGSGTTLEKFANTLRAIANGQTVVPILLVSIGVLVTIVGLERVNKKIPGALIAVVGSIVLSYVFNFAAHSVTTIGTVPSGLPPIGLPAITSGELLSDVTSLLPVAFSMFILILAQSAATSRAYAMKYDDSFNENVDLIGLGLANAAAGLSGTFVVNGSPTKTEMVDNAGGRSQLAMLTTGVVVVVVLLFLTYWLSFMPNAVLSSVVFLIGLKLIDYIGMRGVYGMRRDEFIVAAITAAVVVVVGVEQGIILAILLSLVLVLMHVYKPHDRVLSFGADGLPVVNPVGQPVQAAPGLVIYDFGAELFYANSTRFTEEIMDIVESADPPIKWLAINAAAMGDVDFSGADSIRQIQNELVRQNGTLVLCAVDPAVRALLDAYGLTAKIGAEHFFDRPQDVVAAYAKLAPATS